ncbi:MAG: MATE family efflux transporter [Candidatus Bipolaricaulia bacterium]
MRDKAKALGTDPIRKLILRLATPSVISLGVLAFYNLVDAIYVGRGVGTLAMAAIGVTFPILLVIIGIGQLIGVGCASVVSRALGRGDSRLAGRAVGNAVTVGAIASVLVAVLGRSYGLPLLRFAGATSDVLPDAYAYASVILAGAFTFIFPSIFMAVLRAQGDASRATVPTIVGGVLNVFLDPLFIFGFRMGTAGAAWATVISCGVGLGYYVYNVLQKKAAVRLSARDLVLRVRMTWQLVSIGFPSFVGIFASSATTVVINRTLGVYGGGVALAVYSVLNRIITLARMPVFGVADGSQPIYAYNYGAGNYARVIATLKHALVLAIGLAAASWGVLLLLPRPLLAMFSSDPTMISQGAIALRITVAALPLLALQPIVGSFYQAMGRAGRAFALSLLRDIALVIPGVLVLSAHFSAQGVWVAFPIADFVSALVVTPMLILETRRLRHMALAAGLSKSA